MALRGQILICTWFHSRYSDVTEDGEFKSEVGSGRARFLTVADQVYPLVHLLIAKAWYTRSISYMGHKMGLVEIPHQIGDKTSWDQKKYGTAHSQGSLRLLTFQLLSCLSDKWMMKMGEIRDSFGTPLVKNCEKISDMYSWKSTVSHIAHIACMCAKSVSGAKFSWTTLQDPPPRLPVVKVRPLQRRHVRDGQLITLAHLLHGPDHKLASLPTAVVVAVGLAGVVDSGGQFNGTDSLSWNWLCVYFSTTPNSVAIFCCPEGELRLAIWPLHGSIVGGSRKM